MRPGRHRGQGQRRTGARGGSGGGPIADSGGDEWTAGATDNGANLPNVKLNTTFTLNTGTVHSVSTAGQFSTALTAQASQDNPLIVLTANIDITSSFQPPARTGAGTCQIMSEKVYLGTFGKAPGKRVGPSDAADMFRIRVTSVNTGHFIFNHAASPPSNYRFIGLELDATALQQQPFIGVNGDTATEANLCQWIGIDRCYLHGGGIGTTAQCRAGARMDGKNTYIIDSYFSNFGETGAEAKCFLQAKAGAGHKFVNNYLEAVSVNYMSGGENHAYARTPSDVEFRYNYIKKLASWAPTYTGDHKNLFEIKYGSRFLIEGNYFERSIQGGQNGMAINLQSSSQGGDASHYKLVDVVFRYNRIKDYNWTFMVAGGRNGSTQTTERIVIRDNVFHGRIVSSQNIALFQGTTTDGGGLSDFVLINNVLDATNDAGGSLWTGNSNQTNLKIEGNITRGGDLLWADGVANTTTSFNTLWTGTKTLQDNFHYGTWQGTTANDNTLSTVGTWDGIWTNPAGEDFSITTGHAALGTGIGGANPGPDVTTYNTRQQYTLNGQRPSAP